MCCKSLNFVTVILTITYTLCTVGYQTDIPTFKVGSNLSGKNESHCPCEEVNSTFYRSCGVIPKVSDINIPRNGTHFGEFPWQVAIIEKYVEEFLCSGVLIAPRIVLTAVRCIQDIPITHIRVRLGEWDILSEGKNPFETYGSVEIAISKKYFNPDFTTVSEIHASNEKYNLAILKMVRSVNFDEYPHIAPICLPVIMNNKANLSECVVTGWSESAVKPLNEFIAAYADNSTFKSKGIHSMSITSTYSPDEPENHCHIPPGSLQEGLTECAPLKTLHREVGSIIGQIRGKLQENVGEEERSNSAENYPEKGEVFSRILWKSAARVLPQGECSKIMKHFNMTVPKPSQLCIASHEDSQTCLGDIGSPVICRLVEDRKRNTKDIKKPDERSPKFAVVGIITQSYTCSKDEASMLKYPILATSVSRSLDQVCRIMTSSTFFKVVN